MEQSWLAQSPGQMALKDESVGMAEDPEVWLMMRRRVEAIAAHFRGGRLRAGEAQAMVAESSVGTVDSEGGAASDDKIFECDALEWESKPGRFGREAGQVRFERNGGAKVALPDVD